MTSIDAVMAIVQAKRCMYGCGVFLGDYSMEIHVQHCAKRYLVPPPVTVSVGRQASPQRFVDTAISTAIQAYRNGTLPASRRSSCRLVSPRRESPSVKDLVPRSKR